MGSFTEEDFGLETWDIDQVAKLFNRERARIRRGPARSTSSLKIAPREKSNSPLLFSRESVMEAFTTSLRNYTGDPEVLARQILLDRRGWIGVGQARPLLGYTVRFVRASLDSGALPIPFVRISGHGHRSILYESLVEWFIKRLKESPGYADVNAAALAEQLLCGKDAWLLPGEAARLAKCDPRTLLKHTRRIVLLPDSVHHRYLKSDVLKRRSGA